MARRAAAALAALALLGGCVTRTPPPPAAAAAAPAVCRVGPDGGPVDVADKGIGGTGGPMLADKGIGGTGIIAVISGFASICLAGEEVALPPGAPILLGNEPAQANQLRAGQVAVIDAGDTGAGLAARRVFIRFEVSGPVQSVDGDRLVVAGQSVAVTAQTLGSRPAPGDWVAVSGLRRVDGVIEATRLEPRPPGPLLIHGVLRRDGGAFHLGALVVPRAPGMDALVGQDVTVTGRLLGGDFILESITPDLLLADPGAFFGPAVGTVLIEGYGEFGGGRLRLAGGFAAPLAGNRAFEAGRGVYRFQRDAGGLRAVGGPGDGVGRPGFGPGGLTGGAGRGEGFGPAPVPNRGMPGGVGSDRSFGGGFGGRGGPDGRGGFGQPGPDRTGPGAGPGMGRGR